MPAQEKRSNSSFLSLSGPASSTGDHSLSGPARRGSGNGSSPSPDIRPVSRQLPGFFPAPVRSFRHRDLEPGAFAMGSRLVDKYTGDGQDLTGKEEAKPCILAISFLKDLLFHVERDPDAVVLDSYHHLLAFDPAPDRDCCHPLPMPDRIVEEVEKNLLEHRVGEYLITPAGAGNGQVLGFSGFDNIPDPVPCRGLDPQFLVGPRKLDLPLDHAYCFLDLGKKPRNDRIGPGVLGELGIP